MNENIFRLEYDAYKNELEALRATANTAGGSDWTLKLHDGKKKLSCCNCLGPTAVYFVHSALTLSYIVNFLAQTKADEYRRRYEQYRDDVQVKIKFLSENKVNISDIVAIVNILRGFYSKALKLRYLAGH